MSQRAWQTEIGIRGGFSVFQLTGAGKPGRFDLLDLPSSDILNVFPTHGALFVVIPGRGKLAFEPSLSFYQAVPIATGGTAATTIGLGLRADYAFTPKFYGAAGAILTYVDQSGGTNERQLGLQAAVGYRMHLSGRLNGRVEAQLVTMKKASDAPPYNVYSLLFGASAGTGSRPAARTRTQRAWSPALGVTAGYVHNHVNGGGDFTTFTLPGGGTGGASGISIPGPATMFIVVPIGTKLAVETGWDFHRIKTYGSFSQTIFVGQIAPRLNYAFNGRWYGALGPAWHLIKAGAPGTSIPLLAQSGATLAAGHRFPLLGDIGGRVELNYEVYKRHRGTALFANDFSTFGVQVGASMALK
jgi:hypothetical protein